MILYLFGEIRIQTARKFGVTEGPVNKLVHLQLAARGVAGAPEGQTHPHHPRPLNLDHRYVSSMISMHQCAHFFILLTGTKTFTENEVSKQSFFVLILTMA
jgi:hypothetical protein